MLVHLVDGTYELFRSYFAAPSRKTADGKEFGAAIGVVSSLSMMLRRPEVTHVAIAFDSQVRSFRNEIFDGYKNGESIEPDLLVQFPIIESLTEAMGLTVWRMIEFEADDALAAGAAIAARDPRVDQVVIASPDKDLCQCVQKQRVVTWDRRRDLTYDDKGVVEKFGVEPASIPDYLALVGDASDGIPGIKGWGAKSTAAVLARYGHLESIPADVEAWDIKVRGAKSLSESLNASVEHALLYRKLATLRRDVPLNQSVDDWECRGPDLKKMQKLSDELGDEKLLSRVQPRSS